MKLYELNTKLLKAQQERIDTLTSDLEFFKDLCRKLSAPIKKEKKTSKTSKT